MKPKILAFFGISGIIIVLLAALLVAWIMLETPTLDVRLHCPGSVAVGEEFDLVLETRNLHSKIIRLDCIDVDNGFLSGFEIVSIDPPSTSSMNIFGMQSLDFEESVSPDETLTVTFTLKALKQGHYVGDVDVCNTAQHYTTVVPNVDVLAE